MSDFAMIMITISAIITFSVGIFALLLALISWKGNELNHNYFNVSLVALTAVPYHLIFFYFLSRIHFNIWVAFLVVHVIALFGILIFYNKFLYLLYGARSEKRYFMNEEKGLLLPLYLDVKENTKKEINKSLLNDLTLNIVDELTIRGFASYKNIILSKGAIESLTPDEIKGLLAHEMGHHKNQYPDFLSALQASMIFGTLLVTLYKNIKKLSSAIIKHNKSEIVVQFPNFFMFIFDFLFLAPTFYFKLVSALPFRANEFYADEFAVKIGYGAELKSALKVIYQMELTRKLTIMDRLMMTHPPTAIRIVNIEKLIGEEYDSIY